MVGGPSSAWPWEKENGPLRAVPVFSRPGSVSRLTPPLVLLAQGFRDGLFDGVLYRFCAEELHDGHRHDLGFPGVALLDGALEFPSLPVPCLSIFPLGYLPGKRRVFAANVNRFPVFIK